MDSSNLQEYFTLKFFEYIQHLKLQIVKSLDKIIAFFAEGGNKWDASVTAETVALLNKLDNPGRRELRSRLFNEAKKCELKDTDFNALDWLQECYSQIDKHTFRLHHVYFSPGYDILDNLRAVIDLATETLDLCVFSITDERLAKAINRAAKRGVYVRLITDDLKTLDRGSKIDWLNGNGIAVKIDHSRYHMHHKFGVIDNRIVFTGSFNWTYTATKHNHENVLVTTNHSIVRQYAEEYEGLWKEMFEY